MCCVKALCKQFVPSTQHLEVIDSKYPLPPGVGSLVLAYSGFGVNWPVVVELDLDERPRQDPDSLERARPRRKLYGVDITWSCGNVRLALPSYSTLRTVYSKPEIFKGSPESVRVYLRQRVGTVYIACTNMEGVPCPERRMKRVILTTKRLLSPIASESYSVQIDVYEKEWRFTGSSAQLDILDLSKHDHQLYYEAMPTLAPLNDHVISIEWVGHDYGSTSVHVWYKAHRNSRTHMGMLCME